MTNSGRPGPFLIRQINSSCARRVFICTQTLRMLSVSVLLLEDCICVCLLLCVRASRSLSPT